MSFDSSHAHRGDDWDSQATVNLLALFHVSHAYDGLTFTKLDTSSPDIPAWGLVV